MRQEEKAMNSKLLRRRFRIRAIREQRRRTKNTLNASEMSKSAALLYSSRVGTACAPWCSNYRGQLVLVSVGRNIWLHFSLQNQQNSAITVDVRNIFYISCLAHICIDQHPALFFICSFSAGKKLNWNSIGCRFHGIRGRTGAKNILLRVPLYAAGGVLACELSLMPCQLYEFSGGDRHVDNSQSMSSF